MMHRVQVIFLLLFSLSALILNAQYDPLHPPNSFASDDNPLYWKNRKPHSNYWQQDVHYSIKAALDDQNNRIEGTMKLVYTNNSPDTLRQLVFHLYQNAFDSGSYASQYSGTKANKSESPYQHTTVSDLTVDAMEVSSKLDNTILFVELTSPLRPGEDAEIECRFTTQFGRQSGRMKMYNAWGYKHFNVVHWYPRISVYDQTFNWTTDQHLGHEFYGDFGAFDVELTLPEHYIMDGTGFLLNRDEVLPSALMDKLRIENFVEKPWNEAPSEIIPASGKTKTWKFHAENVHDFAWTADPTYRIGVAKTTLSNGHEVTCYALAQEPHASGWQNAASYTAEVIDVYSRDFGAYAYHKMIVADARDGMEYPMLTLDGGRDPGYRGLLAHEVGHNWFFGMVGNNETYRAALDEGFTQFLTSWALTEIEGDTADQSTDVLGIRGPFKEERLQRDLSVYDGYFYSSLIADDDPKLNTHSDRFDNRRQYGQVYYKTATMLYNLEYVLGDELFKSAMQHYFDQWKFCHPYFDDFRRSVIQYTDVDLNWFFDVWLEDNQTIDYRINYLRSQGDGVYNLLLERKGMQMPLDIMLVGKSGKVYNYHIPNNYFTKETEAEILPMWYGWGDFNETYTVEVNPGEEIKRAIIDPTNRLADVYMLDNQSVPPVRVELNDFQANRPERAYEVEWNPTVWYNGYDGVKAGLSIHGDYANTYHLLDAKLWFNSGLAQQSAQFNEEDQSSFNRFNYMLSYTDPLRSWGDDLSYTYKSKWLEGLFANDLSLRKVLSNNKTTLKVGLSGLYRPDITDLNYLIYGEQWNADKWNNFTEFEVHHLYRYGRNSVGRIRGNLRSPFLFSDYQYGYLNLDVVNDNRVSFLNLRTRVFGQLGAGSNWAPESQLYAASANPEQMMENPIIRSAGIVPSTLYGYDPSIGNFQVGGGLNLRGYNNYLMPHLNEDSLLRFGNVGQTGLAFNTEIEFDDAVRLFRGLRRFAELKTYAFADAGLININRMGEEIEFSKLRMDAGIGTALEIKRWGKYSDLKPFTLRFDMPLFLNRPPAGDEYVSFRWLIGFERAF